MLHAAGDTRPQSLGGSAPLVRPGHPYADAALARLYDAFPFAADLPLYTRLAHAQGGHVLELGCGTGRVLVPLAVAGVRVVGLEVSPAMAEIALAKLEAAGAGVRARCRVVAADMRSFRLEERFDLAVIAVNTFGYLLARSDQQSVLRRVADHLRPGGLLALDLKHPSPEWLLERTGSLTQDLCATLADGTVVTRTETVLDTDGAAQVRLLRSAYDIVATDGSVTRRMVEWPLRYFHRFEAELLLEAAGFTVEAVNGGYAGEPFTAEGRNMVLLGRRPG